MHLLIGLGNPGASYALNRHNAGFLAVDAIADAFSAAAPAVKFGGELQEARFAGSKLFLFKPMSYMNRSGIPASQLAAFYKIPLENIIVFHDELDLPLGKIRVKRGGGHGGHNGLKSLDAHIGQAYERVRIGIGHPGRKEMVHSHVLSNFDDEEMNTIEPVFKAMAEHAPLLLQGDAAGYMNKLAPLSKKE